MKRKGENGKILVTRIYNEGGLTNESSDEKRVEVSSFADAPVARVGYSEGMTVNLGNFESARISVTVELPTYVEELEDAYEVAKTLPRANCEAKLKGSVTWTMRVLGSANGQEKFNRKGN